MPHHKSTEKRLKQTYIRTARNKSRMNRIRTFIKKVEQAIALQAYDEACEAFRKVQPEIHRGVSKGILHKNRGARKLSRLFAKIKALQSL